MIELTEQQCQQLSSAESIIVNPQTQETYVLVPRDVYERLKGLLYKCSDWTPSEQLRLLVDSGMRAGWSDPAIDVYDNYDESRKKLCQ